jgi:hypothetical protein
MDFASIKKEVYPVMDRGACGVEKKVQEDLINLLK